MKRNFKPFGVIMKSLVKAKREPGIWMQEVPVPEYGVNDVLIKIKMGEDKNINLMRC